MAVLGNADVGFLDELEPLMEKALNAAKAINEHVQAAKEGDIGRLRDAQRTSAKTKGPT